MYVSMRLIERALTRVKIEKEPSPGGADASVIRSKRTSD
jgi:hypothetical protein